MTEEERNQRLQDIANAYGIPLARLKERRSSKILVMTQSDDIYGPPFEIQEIVVDSDERIINPSDFVRKTPPKIG